jgi:hypothetical protein
MKLEILPGQPNMKVTFDKTNSLHYSAMITNKKQLYQKIIGIRAYAEINLIQFVRNTKDSGIST